MATIGVFLLSLGFLVIAVLGGENSPWLSGLATTFISILLEAIPFIILGSLVSGLLEVFVPAGAFNRFLPKNRVAAVCCCALLGILFPICECGVVPIVRRLIRKGVPAGCAITYMLAAPIINPVVAASTMVAFQADWLVLGMRLGLGFVVASAIGLFFTFALERSDGIIKPGGLEDGHDHDHDHDHSHDDACGCATCADDEEQTAGASVLGRLARSLDVATHDFFLMGRYLILGSLLAALIQVSVSRGELIAIGSGRISGPVTMILLAIALNLCSEADAFVASSFLLQFSLPSILAFLVLGPMFDIKLFLMYFEIFRKRTIALLATLTVLLVFAVTVVLDPKLGDRRPGMSSDETVTARSIDGPRRRQVVSAPPPVARGRPMSSGRQQHEY